MDRYVGLATPGRNQKSRAWRFMHPLIAICAVQAGLSLTLVWSNTAFGDEALYLWAGHLEWAHWLHDKPLPQFFSQFSGSPVIYPPLGALADTFGGLAAARILSLIFMLSATILLYLTASRLLGHTGAIVAASFWALSEPALRLAFATFDPLSVFLTALSAWLAVQAAYRRGRIALVAASAAALALANVAAYSGIVIDPVVIAFAFLIWLPPMRVRQAVSCVACLTGGVVLFFCILMTASDSWAGTTAIFSRSSPDHQGFSLALNNILTYSGLIVSVALIGSITALAAERRQRAALLALLGCAAFVVPAAQLYNQTAWSLDKHLAYGIWFAAIAAGYACTSLIRWVPGARGQLAAVCCVIALAYPTVNNWESASTVDHGWANAGSFLAAFRPVAAQSGGLIYVSGQNRIAQYYTPQGRQWGRWTTKLSLDPTGPSSTWPSYYTTLLRSRNYGTISLFYTTSFAPTSLPPGLLLSRRPTRTYQGLLSVFGANSGEPGLPILTQILERDPQYRLVTVGPYDSAHDNGAYAIWRKLVNK